MRRCCIRRAYVAKQYRTCDAPSVPIRCFHTTQRAAEGEDQNSEKRNPTPVRSRSASNAAKVWDQLSQLQNASSPTRVHFDDAVKALGGRTFGSRTVDASTAGATPTPPREVVRRGSFNPRTSVSRGRDGPRLISVRSSRDDPVEMARSDLVKFQSVTPQARGRGGFRGGAATRGRGRGMARGGRGRDGGAREGDRDGRREAVRGRGGNPSGPGRRQGRGAGESDDVDERDDDWETYTGYYQLFTSEEHIDSFVSLDEAQSYARVQEFVDEYDDAVSLLGTSINDLAETRQHSSQELAEEAESALQDWDADIRDALEHVVEADEKAYPRHEPGEFSLDSLNGEVGRVPIGQAGMGNVVEDGIRYVSKREGLLWRDAKELAQQLVDGDFVRFRNLPEMREVLRLAEELSYNPDTPEGTEHCGFEAPSEGAKQLLVGTLVRGQYQDPQDDGLRAEVLRNAARITAGNASYPTASKHALLNTIRQLLPAERGSQQATQRTR